MFNLTFWMDVILLTKYEWNRGKYKSAKVYKKVQKYKYKYSELKALYACER